MRLIGLCGKSGSGKGVFAKLASENGIKVIDCDAVYKDLVSRRTDCLNAIESSFGSKVIKNNALDRRALAPIVFSDKKKLQLLNTITHAYIRNEIAQIVKNGKEDDLFLLDAPTLFESKLHNQCNKIVGIITPDNICAERIMQRDGITKEEAYARLNNQIGQETLLQNCDYIVNNASSLEAFCSDSLKVINCLKEEI